MAFTLHPKLDEDCEVLGELTLCRVLLMNDKHYPWFILVPKREDKREVYELDYEDQLLLNKESTALAQFAMGLYGGEKMNTAALGNVVPQLHIHHIVRFSHDTAWPGPVWGKIEASAYTEEEISKIKQQFEVFFTTFVKAYAKIH